MIHTTEGITVMFLLLFFLSMMSIGFCYMLDDEVRKKNNVKEAKKRRKV